MPPGIFALVRFLPRKLLRFRKRQSPQQGQSVWDHLPIELWHCIFCFLDKRELAALSSTCSLLRNLAAPRLFSSLRLRVGHYTLFHLDDNEEGHAKHVKKSIPVLRRLAKPKKLVGGRYVFNDLVRSLRIVAGMRLENKEKQILLLALGSLPGLFTFDWMGSKLPEEVAAMIASHCTGIQTLRVASIGNLALRELCALQGRPHTIELIDACLSSWRAIGPYIRDIFEGRLETNPVQELLESNRANLRKLTVFGPDLRQNNMKLFDSFLSLANNIVHLAINGTGDLPGFDQFLLHSTVLESLTLLDATSLSFLPCSSKQSLPNLKNLKLGINTCPASTAGPDMRVLSETLLTFVRDHSNLRRFDFSLWPSIEPPGEESLDENGIWFSSIIEAACVLEDAQALGITFPSLTPNTVQESLNSLGRAKSLHSCTALRLEGISNGQIGIITEKLCRCTFIAISALRHTAIFRWRSGAPVVTIEELVYHHGLRQLDQVLLYDRMYDIIPSGDSGAESIVLKPWNSDRARWRTEADFYNQDAYWLMSYRRILNIDIFIRPEQPAQD